MLEPRRRERAWDSGSIWDLVNAELDLHIS